MTFLFDISPAEPPDGRKNRSAEGPAAAGTAKDVEFRVGDSSRTLTILGAIDDFYQCPDGRCGAWAHDIIDVRRHEWRVECAFCGTGQWVEPVPGVIDKDGDVFKLRGGRFDGLTIDEVSKSDRGLEYIAFAADKHSDDRTRKACRVWLDLKAARA